MMSRFRPRNISAEKSVVAMGATGLALVALASMFILLIQTDYVQTSHAIEVTTPDAGQGPHANYDQPTVWCARCHAVHTGVNRRFTRGYWNQDKSATEEGLCYTCHDGTGAGATVSVYNLQDQFEKAFHMPIEDNVGVHIGREPSATNDQGVTQDPVGPNSRHVECLDCHNPHVDRGPNHKAYIGGETTDPIGGNEASKILAGVWGVTVDYSIDGGLDWDSWTTEFNTGDAYSVVSPDIEYEWQLCFKCHSAFAYAFDPPVSPSFEAGFNVPNSYDGADGIQTDPSKEFNPNNASYHPVMAAGQNPFDAGGTDYSANLRDINGASADGQLTPESLLHCSDCHRRESTEIGLSPDLTGPHGSDNPFLLMGAWSTELRESQTIMDDTDEYPENEVLCFNCHDRDSYLESSGNQTGFTSSGGANRHDFHMGERDRGSNAVSEQIQCMNCHVGVIHGYNRDHLLVATADDYPYRTPWSRLLTSDSWETRASRTWTEGTCDNAMFGGGDCH